MTSHSGSVEAPAVGALDLSIIWSTLISICAEMGATLRSTAFSEAVREADDFSTGLFDGQGRLIAQGNFTPGHLGSMPYVVEHVEACYPRGSLQAGDCVILNDSGMCSGHFPDIYMVTPVHVGGRFCGYAVNIAHHVDVGGAAPGSQKVDLTEAFQEGIRVLPIRAVVAGEWNEEVLRTILGNVRLPDIVRGDLSAQRNANNTGVERLRELIETYGNDLFEAAVEEILNRTEARTREVIRALPEGVYRFEDTLEPCLETAPTVKTAVEITIKDGEIVADFSASGDQVPAAINSYINYTRAHGFFAIQSLAETQVPYNAGGLRPLKVMAREGSFFNPRFPAPSGGRAVIGSRTFEVVNGALAQCMPERAMAAFSHMSNGIWGGVSSDSGKRFIFYDLIYAGYGGRLGADGVEGLSPVQNCKTIPTEVQETFNPILIHCLETIPDSGGAGQFRGGCGLRKDVELLEEEAIVTLLGDRHLRPPYGLQGGAPGALAQTILNPHRNSRELQSKETLTIRKGDIISYRLAGGGGYGDPALRDPAAITADIADGYVTPEGARAYRSPA